MTQICIDFIMEWEKGGQSEFSLQQRLAVITGLREKKSIFSIRRAA